MGLKDLFKGMLHKDPRLKEMETEVRMQKIVEDRMKSANERELERFHEEEREKSIKKNLEEFRNARKKEEWSGDDNILKTPNMFKGKGSKCDVLKQDFNVLSGKKLFMGRGNMFKGGGSLK